MTFIVGNTTVIGPTGTIVTYRLSNSNISANTSANSGYHYIASSKLTLTLPSTPTVGDVVGFSNQASAGSVIARNGNNINGFAEDLIIDRTWIAIRLQYSSNSTLGWVFV